MENKTNDSNKILKKIAENKQPIVSVLLISAAII